MYRNDEKGHEAVEQVDELSRLEDETRALEAELDAWDREDRGERNAREERSFRKYRIVEIMVGAGVLVVAWAAASQGC
jgi:hypothetical protein